MTHDESEYIGEPLDDVPKREPGEYCNARKSDGDVFDGYCQAYAGAGTDHSGEGRCQWHGGGTPTKDENPDVGAPEGNDNAADHEAFREFFEETLTDGETQAVRQAERLLENTATAQQVGRTAAALCLVQYRRTGDERFLRRFESICDTFGIAPEDVEHVEVEGSLEAEMTVELDEETDRRIGQMMEALEGT